MAQFDIFSTAFGLCEWTMFVKRKEDLGRQLRLITPKNEGEDETSFPSPPRFTFFDDPDFPLNSPDTLPGPPGPKDSPGLLTRIAPSSSTCWWERRARTEHVSRERSRQRPRSQSPEPQLKPIPVSDNDDDQSPQDGRQRQRSRSRDRVHPPAQAPQVPPIQPMDIQEPFTVLDEDTGSSGRRQRSRSRERAPAHVTEYTDDESAAAEPQKVHKDRERKTQPN